MALLKDYLRNSAKFHSPTPGTNKTSVTDVSPVEVAALLPAWKPLLARRDTNMVGALIGALDKYLGDSPSPEGLDIRFEPIVDGSGLLSSWQRNTVEAHARFMVESGALNSLGELTRQLGCPVTLETDYAPAEGVFASKVDFAVFASENKKVLVEIKAPNVLNLVATLLERPGFPIRWSPDEAVEHRVISKACLYMASHRARWLALTSHDTWIFLRLHVHETDPYVTFSSIEHQTDNTRPFRALLGMMLATELDLDVESEPEMVVQLEPIAEVPELTPGSSQDEEKADKRGSYRGRGPVTREDLLLTRASARTRILMSWSLRVSPNNIWFSLDATDGTDQCASIGAKSVRFRLQHKLGQGSTGVVYKAALDVDGCDEESESPSYAIKVVYMCKSEDERRRQRLHDEFNIYRLIEQARRKGDLGNVTPRCYGLFEDKYTSALVMDYGGETLKGVNWASLNYHEKDEIFDAVRKLHTIGINHYDLELRNIVRKADGTFNVIDFSSSKIHNCNGIRDYPKRVAGGKKGAECNELKRLQSDLMKREPLK